MKEASPPICARQHPGADEDAGESDFSLRGTVMLAYLTLALLVSQAGVPIPSDRRSVLVPPPWAITDSRPGPGRKLSCAFRTQEANRPTG